MTGEIESRMRLSCLASVFVTHSSECAQQLSAAEEDLARLQTLIDDAMGQMASAFARLAPAAQGTDAAASDVVVTTLQYQDIFSQLVTHLRRRLARTGALVGGLNLPFSAAMAATRGDQGVIESVSSRVGGMNEALENLRRLTHSHPVRQEHACSGEVELF